MISHRGAADRAAFESDPQSRACDLDVGDGRQVRSTYASLVKGDGDDSFTLIRSRRTGD